MTKRIALWAHPRSLSTAFERIFVERADATVIHEPYSHAFFFGEERSHPRFAAEPIAHGHRFADVTKRLRSPVTTPILFFKDLAFHLTGRMREELLVEFANTFIIRRPEAALASFYRKLPDFDWIEAGYEALVEMFELVVRTCGQPVIILDADDLSRTPHQVVHAYCQRVGIPFAPAALHWSPRTVPEFGSWEGWHDEAQFSTGITQAHSNSDIVLPPRVRRRVDAAQPVYERLAAHRIRMEATT